MADGFLRRYNEELDALRQRAGRFAKAFPKVAGRLRLNAEVADDPHVERLVQSFAYSAARVRQKLDDEFPELSNTLLETLYPHYLAPIPSMSIVRFEPSATLAIAQTISRHSEILAEPVEGESCRFRTTQDVEVLPVTVTSAALSGQPLPAPASPYQGAAACLVLGLASRVAGNPNFDGIGLSRLRLFLAAPWRQASAIAELLLEHTVGIALARHSGDVAPIFLSRDHLKPAGFDEDAAMLPYAPSSFVGYRLLTEFLALPQKFLFVDIDGLDAWKGGDFQIFIYLSQSDSALEQAVTKRDFVVNASPVVNLFRQACEPIPLDGSRTEYRLLPDSRRQKTREVHSLQRVVLSDRTGGELECQPFFGRSLASRTDVFFQIERHFDPDDQTSDVDIAFVDSACRATGPVDCVASVEALCLNRDLPERLPFGGGHPRLHLAEANEAVGALEALLPPTPAVRLFDAEGRSWRLMSHLLLNHLSLADRGGGALKDILQLYAFRDTPETRQIIASIVAVEARTGTARVFGGGMVPGTDITLTLDPATIDRASAYLFGAVLDRFFGLYASINSFTRLMVILRGQSRPVARFPARAAEKPLL